jgi:hypothetical protein
MARTKRPKKLKAVRENDGWQIKEGTALLYTVFLDGGQKILHVSPVPDTLEALESGRRYYRNLLDGPWLGKDPDGSGAAIKNSELVERLDAIRSLCLPFPNIGDRASYTLPVSEKVLQGTVLEVGKHKRGFWRAWFKPDGGATISVSRKELSKPKAEAKSANA